MVRHQSLMEKSGLTIPSIAETIVRGVNIVGKDLIRRRGENTEINVYFTG